MPDPGTRTEVAEDRALLELCIDGCGLRHADDHRASPPNRIARRVHPEARCVGELDEQLGLAQRVLTNSLDADLLDQVVARRSREVSRRIRRPGKEARGATRVLHRLRERERPVVRLPARVCRLESLGEIGPDVEPAVARPAAEPLHRPADGEVDPERRDVDRDDSRRLVAVEDHVRAHLVCALHDRQDVLDLRVLVEDVADRDEQRPLVDPLDDLGVVLAHDDFEVGLRLVQVAHGREVPALVDDAVARRVDRPEARERDRLGDRDVLVHHSRARRRADDPPDLVSDRHRHRPPALGPGADPTLRPHARELGEALRHPPRHRAQRVAGQVGRMLENRELGAIVEEVAHEPESARDGRLGRCLRRDVPADVPPLSRPRADASRGARRRRPRRGRAWSRDPRLPDRLRETRDRARRGGLPRHRARPISGHSSPRRSRDAAMPSGPD